MEFLVMSFPVPILYPFCVEADFRYESVRISVDENPCSVHYDLLEKKGGLGRCQMFWQ